MASTVLHDLSSAGGMMEEIPRPEYPQPQFQRAEWLNLNGYWQFAFDDQNAGASDGWHMGDAEFARNILVPFCFESEKSGIGDTGFHPVVWYRRSFVVPADWGNRRVLLHFGAVDYRARVWVNGRPVGEHEGGHTPFRFDITDALQPGSNTVTVRAEDPPTDRFIPRGKQYWELKSESIFYTRTTGIWQTVWLEPVGESYLQKLRIDPDMNGTVSFDAVVARPQPGLQLHATVRFDGQVVATGMGQTVNELASAGIVIRYPKLWAPQHPNLYDVTFELRKGDEVLDRVDSYFGFRTIAVQDGQILLNNNPIYLKLVLDQGYWPESIMTPPSDLAIQYDIQCTKEMGFNGARKHQKVEDPRYLYWADKMGLLVSAEMANAYDYDVHYVSRITREWMDVVERDYNHPSIIIWVPLNESWGVPNLRDPRQAMHLRAMYTLTKSLDMTRLVIDNDGWEHSDLTDLFAMHDYTKNGEIFYERFKDVVTNIGKPGAIIPNYAKMNTAPGYSYNGSPLYLSEFGGISYIPPAEEGQVPSDSWGYSGIEPTAEAALARMKNLYQGIAKVPQITAVCYTQLADVEQEVNGLLTYDRKPKFAFEDIKKINDILTANRP